MMEFDGLRICLLTDQEIDSGLPLPDDDWPCDPRPYLPEADWTVLTLEKETAVAALLGAAREGFDVYFNLCDGAWDEARPGIEVVHTLERLDVPFTGAHSGFYEPSREAMKRVCDDVGVLAPAGIRILEDSDVQRAAASLRFPLIVKHPSSYASVGLTPESRVDTVDQLRAQVARMLEMHHGALVEEFIEGDEYTVLVAENADPSAPPVTYQPLRYRFPEGETFKHERLKWVHYHGLEAGPVDDPDLDRRLRDDCARFFAGLGGSGYARCDVRVDAAGRPFVLELNPNCGLFYPPTDAGSADLILQWDPAGHEGFVRTVLEAALARHRRRRSAWTAGRTRRGYGLLATRSVAVGEPILNLEGASTELVRRDRLEAVDDPVQRRRLIRGAWPLTRDLWIAAPRDPMAWRPLNHACDPSAWVCGLELQARRALEPGDEITVDYATLYDEILPDFACDCGGAECRGTIRGTDWRSDGVARYGAHLSDYIRDRRSTPGPG
ncbi:SET domain-containing protein-lysine N-methyltransferase [Gemmatimonadota bacterium Y43]|uniref:SET domain-containing protein-lysine N-methyltransferase n=1 Tax=Gaopeijia maritima TaxID=3119007 RepID=UPI00327B1C3B